MKTSMNLFLFILSFHTIAAVVNGQHDGSFIREAALLEDEDPQNTLLDMVDSIKSMHAGITKNRRLIHTIPPLSTPKGCEYSHDHSFPILVDTIVCPDVCGPGHDISLTVTSTCNDDGTSCSTVADCPVSGGCENKDCGSGVGECPCNLLEGAVFTPSYTYLPRVCADCPAVESCGVFGTKMSRQGPGFCRERCVPKFLVALRGLFGWSRYGRCLDTQ